VDRKYRHYHHQMPPPEAAAIACTDADAMSNPLALARTLLPTVLLRQ
jgi:hypothetical protein